MKNLVLVAAALFSLGANAAPSPEAVKTALSVSGRCENFIRFDDENLYLGYGRYRNFLQEPRTKMPGAIKLVSLANPFQSTTLTTLDSAIDVVRAEQNIYVLTYSGIEVWDLNTQTRSHVIATTRSDHELAYLQHARAFIKYGNKLFVAHGRLGVTVIDLVTEKITRELNFNLSQAPLESMATGIVAMGDKAYVLVDNFSQFDEKQKPFRGLIALDLLSEKIIAKYSGLLAGASSLVGIDDTLVVSFSGIPLLKYSIADLAGSKMPEPRERVTMFPVEGLPFGSAAIDSKNYYTCFSKLPTSPSGKPTDVGVAFDRAELKF